MRTRHWHVQIEAALLKTTTQVSLWLCALKTKERVRKNCKKLKASCFRSHLKRLFWQKYYFSGFNSRSQKLRKHKTQSFLQQVVIFDVWSLIKGDDGRLRWGWEARPYSNTHKAPLFSLLFFWHCWQLRMTIPGGCCPWGSGVMTAPCSILSPCSTGRTLRWSHEPPSSL